MKPIENKKARPLSTVLFMTAATLLSKLLGMLRGIIFAAVYGADIEANAITVAQHIPLTCFDLLLSAAILGCFIPAYAGFFGGDGDDKASGEGDAFAQVFLSTIILITSLLALVGMIFAKPLVSLMAPGLDAETSALASRLLRIMFPMIIFTGAAYTLVGVMQTKGRYFLPSMISAVSNAGIIIYLLAIDPLVGEGGVYGLAIAYLCAWFLQFLTLALPLYRSGFKFSPRLDFKNRALREALKKLPPIMAGSWLMPVTIYSGIYFTSLVTEKVAVFEYANSIYVLVTGILTYSICNYIFPKLSKLSNVGEGYTYAETTVMSLRVALCVMLPFAAAVAVLYGEGTSILYLRKNFDAHSAELTAGLVRMTALSMPFFSITELLSRAFYAQKRTREPMIAAVCGIAVNIAVSIAVVSSDGAKIMHIGIPYALGQITSAVILLAAFVRQNRQAFGARTVLSAVKLILGGVIAFVIMSTISHFIGNDPYSAGIVKNIIVCVVTFVPAAVFWLLWLKLTRAFTHTTQIGESESEQTES